MIGLQCTSWKRKKKECTGQSRRKSAVKQSPLDKDVLTRPKQAISTGILTWKTENFTGPNYKELQATNYCKERENQPLPEISLLLVVQYNMVSPAVIYPQTTNMDLTSYTSKYICMIYIHTYMYMYILTHTYMLTYINMYVYIHIHVCICMYVSITVLSKEKKLSI